MNQRRATALITEQCAGAALMLRRQQIIYFRKSRFQTGDASCCGGAGGGSVSPSLLPTPRGEGDTFKRNKFSMCL